MSVQVCTVFTPRGDPEQWYHYLSLLRLQKETAARFGHSHLVVTDDDLPAEFTTLRVPLDKSLMRSMIVGVIERLLLPWPPTNLLFVDADCLVARDLHEAFDSDFDLGLTRRDDPACPINNGAMYVPRGGAGKAVEVFRTALANCGEHWGADQEAISAAVAPVPEEDGTIAWRGACRVRFLSMLRFAAVPKVKGRSHRRSNPFVVHFKGKEAKEWADEYATRFILAA